MERNHEQRRFRNTQYFIAENGQVYDSVRNVYVKPFLNYNGYSRVNLKIDGQRRKFYVHRLVAECFLNQDPKRTFVDHIDRNRLNNHVSNLRYVSASENNKNKSSLNGVAYEYFDDISDECVVINDYGGHNFTAYYYEESTDSFYVFNGIKYRKLHINYKRNGSAFVIMNDTENKRVRLIISRFKRLYGFI